jgi:hypothetical protein
MPARTNTIDVKAIINTSATHEQVQPYVDDAHAMVDAVLGDEGLSESLLTTIEKWLAAHFIAITKSRQPQYKKIGDGAESYPKLGLKLDASTYGQTALAFDTSGRLANLGMKRAVIKAVPSFDDSPIL